MKTFIHDTLDHRTLFFVFGQYKRKQIFSQYKIPFPNQKYEKPHFALMLIQYLEHEYRTNYITTLSIESTSIAKQLN